MYETKANWSSSLQHKNKFNHILREKSPAPSATTIQQPSFQKAKSVQNIVANKTRIGRYIIQQV